jgi:uncharacterized protein YndB with AHSA1/START domain
VWRHLTEPDLVAEWFGDCDALCPGREFRIDFGDGDFFVGRVAAWEAPGRLELVWKFMALGPEYRITFTLVEVDGATEVAVRDTGALTRAEADGLDEGWRDFLSRLHKRCVTGERARYQWTPSIGLAAVLGVPPAAAGARLLEASWWRDSFPGTALAFAERSTEEVRVTLSEPAWEGARTSAVLRLQPLGADTIVGVTHSGFETLPGDVRLDERRRFAALWETALRAEEATASSGR